MGALAESAVESCSKTLPSRMSARMLGYELGMSARQVNELLLALGFLHGRPSAYGLTEQGIEIGGSETDYDNGYGGYAHRAWSVRTWDPQILDVLRREKDDRLTRPLPVDVPIPALQVPGVVDGDDGTGMSGSTKAVIGIVVVVAVVAAGAAVYQRVRRWRSERRDGPPPATGSVPPPSPQT